MDYLRELQFADNTIRVRVTTRRQAYITVRFVYLNIQIIGTTFQFALLVHTAAKYSAKMIFCVEINGGPHPLLTDSRKYQLTKQIRDAW